MAATNEYLKRRAEYNVAHTKFLFTTVSPYGPPPKETILDKILKMRCWS